MLTYDQQSQKFVEWQEKTNINGWSWNCDLKHVHKMVCNCHVMEQLTMWLNGKETDDLNVRF